MQENRIALVTGGNKGLGYETARRLKEAGQTVYIGARDAERGQTAAEELGVGFVRLDVADERSVAEAAAELERREGRIDVLVNNAGIREPGLAVDAAGVPRPFKEASELTGADAMEVFGTNVFGVVRVTRAFLPLLKKSASPVIVNVSSTMGSFAAVTDPERVESRVSVPLYAASKAALTMLTVQYAKMLPGMRVNAANPGYTMTDFNGGDGAHTAAEGADAIVELATVGADGPTGVFVEREGTVAW